MAERRDDLVDRVLGHAPLARQEPRDLVGDVRIGRSEVQVHTESIVEDRGDVDHVTRDLDDAPLAGARRPQQHLLVEAFHGFGEPIGITTQHLDDLRRTAPPEVLLRLHEEREVPRKLGRESAAERACLTRPGLGDAPAPGAHEQVLRDV